MKKVLVFPCGSEVGLEIFRALQYEKHIELWGGSSNSSNHGKYLFKNYIEGIPFVNEKGFIDSFNDVLKKHSIDYVFPAMDSVLLELSQHQDRLCAKVIGSPYETNRICSSKLETYRLFKGSVPVPEVYPPEDLDDRFNKFPVFLKPETGYGSRGTYIAKSKNEALFYVGQNPSLLILEYLPGEEYTVECFTDYKGELRFVGGRARRRIRGGISVHSEEVKRRDFHNIAETINKELEFRGVWFFQLKENEKGEPALMEAAGRAAGTMALARNKGINLPLLSLYDAQNIDVDIIDNKYKLTIDRALTNRFQLDYQYKYVYVDFDDCVIIDDKINTMLMMFLYQCLNKGIKIILLTRHAGNLLNRLQAFRLTNLFDEVIHISQSDAKAGHIKYRPAIFIDDAFSERLDVSRKSGVPVFDLSSIESLIDWRI